MFIKLKEEDGTTIRLNVNHILTYVWDPVKSLTMLLTVNDHALYFYETPEQIDVKIEKVTTQTVGGGH